MENFSIKQGKLLNGGPEAGSGRGRSFNSWYAGRII
jgi:hypothetical protein